MLVVPHLHNWRKNLSQLALEELDKLLTIKTYSADEFIYSSGDVSNCGYQIVSGKVKICNYSAEGNELIISNLHAGDCVGDLGLITGQNRVNYAIACDDTTLNVLSRNDFEKICLKHPEILVSINKLLCNRLQIVFEMLEDAYLLPLYQRLAKVLVKLALSRGETDNDGNIIVKDVSQETLGHMVGATRQSIGRELKKMEKEKMVSLKYSQLTIPNIKAMIEKFENILAHEPIVSSYPNTKNSEANK